ncbi:DUF6044 family protein [Arsenicibacter rosenii]|uniref:Glycosyltransferase RgtA/B/C/D-like domain-containing protein n=1 Tax=Arsenicibacter rosenii TaxID=1750698 RepID=A0A1S2VR14_9BACT|nr:DUF6044 family protein [Arsenicibacter rosenii]OIN60228.1 hypothetical protein BLX24_05170 [Arsenicibacter rosenii]
MIRSEKTYFISALALLGLYFLPYLLLGEDAYVTIHDNLDSDFLYLHILKISRTAFAMDPMAVVPNMMNGIPRAALRSGLNLEVVLFYWLPSYTAYVVNLVLIRLTGFIGMWLLLRRYLLTEPSWALIRIGIAVCFAIVPGYVVHGISVSGQPLLLYAFLNIANDRQTQKDWLIIGLFPFYSFLVWAGLFIVIALGGLCLYLMWTQRRFHVRLLIATGLLAFGYGISEWQMIYSFAAKLYVSHRTEYDYARLLPKTFVHCWGKSVQLFSDIQYHCGSYSTRWIRGTLVVAAIYAFLHKDGKALRRLAACLLLIIGICLFSGFYRFPAIWPGKGNLLQSFQFDRFYFLLPAIWLWLFALALRIIQQPRWFLYVLVLGQAGIMIDANHEWRVNLRKLAGRPTPGFISYRSFYATEQFAQIRDYIRQPQPAYRVASIGLNPAVSLYNGFYALDSYQNNYLLSYKHAFRNVIAAELAKAPRIRTYYDAYACRCYTYVAELGMKEAAFSCGKNSRSQVKHLVLNTAAFRALGGRYLLSGIPIQNTAINHLKLVRVFNDRTSYWRIYLYDVL